MKEPIGRYLKRQAAGSRRTFLGLAVAGLLCFGLSGTIASQEPAGDDPVDGDSAGNDSGGDALANPFLGDEAAIRQGRRIYRGKCIVCHQKTGGRAKNLFKTKLTDEQFLEVVINGREGTLMPAFGYRMGLDDVWNVHAFVMSTDRYY